MTDVQLPNALANLVKPRRYLSCADTAKLIRRALKEAFPEVKFSVRSHVYSGGASINVGWTDGPTTKQVERVAKTFEGAYFDGMTDYKGGYSCAIDGEPVSFGADFVFCNRDVSADQEMKAADIFARTPRTRWTELMRRFDVSLSDALRIFDNHSSPRGAAVSFLHATPAPQFDGRRSALADSVAVLDKH
ncbi:LPD29 domain-containing protein [Methylocystis sp.]|uniref:LPD29 domain-containing protein n=1 Tax=Methylocystis sp. TaxID=1911079 RepID=UPI002732D9DD|nr:LPD29 domain-containing protein [Methylocystis sp.]MDP3554840.1 LPD29 domain-containing protein [Methylocystis sp.]